MIEILDTTDARAVRNKNMILDHYHLMINNKKAEEGTRNFHAAYIPHNTHCSLWATLRTLPPC
jgi:predicted SnoaL-like aldol condensation-catalyzing enzyme